MAISVKLSRTSSASTANTFVITAGSGDSGKLQIQYNSTDIYNNLSGSTEDIASGAANTTLTIPLDASNEIPKGVYYFNFVADVGSSDTSTINFQAASRTPELGSTSDVYAPSFRVDDDTSYTVDNGTVSATTRTLTLIYPQGSNQANLSAQTTATALADLYITTANVWTGSMQTTLAYNVTYTIAATTGYDTFTYLESGTGYDTEDINPENALCDLYDCMENMRKKVNSAASKKRSNYQELLSDYTHGMSLAGQFREAVTCDKTSALNDIITDMKAAFSCEGSNSTATSQASRKVYGIGGTSEATQDLVADMFTDATNYGVGVEYDDSGTGTISLEGRANFMNVYNDTGAQLDKGKAVYITGYDSASGLNEVSLASNASAASAEAIGIVYADIASAVSGRCLLNGWFESVDTSAFSEGDELFLSTTGDLTASEPAPTAYSQFIATVGEASTTGQLHVAPQKAVNYQVSVSATTAILNLEANMVKVSVSGGSGALNTTPLSAVASASGRIVHIHSAVLYAVSTPTPTPSGTINYDLFINSSGTYSAGDVVAIAQFPTSAALGQFVRFDFQANLVVAETEGLYMGTSADESGNGWDNNVKAIIFYSLYTP